MPEKKETVFASGFYFEKPKEGRPDFIKGRMSIKVEDAVTFLQTYKNAKGYVNLDLLKSRDGSKLYFTLDQWEPTKPATEDVDTGQIPF